MLRRCFLACSFCASLGLGAIGCQTNTPTGGGQIGGLAYGCVPVASTELGPNEASPLGFSAADVLAAVQKSQTVPLTWAKGGTTDLTITVTGADGAIHYVDREWTSPDDAGTQPTGAMSCPDVIEIPIALGFETVDGSFDEIWDGPLLADSAKTAAFTTAIDPDTLMGTYVVTEVDPASFDAIAVWLEATLSPSGPAGKISGQATTQGSDAVTAQQFQVASF